MDLGAYARIDELDSMAKANGIDVERLRGYRLMKDSEAYSDEEIADSLRKLEGTYWWMYSDENEDWYDHSEKEYQAGYRPATWNRLTDIGPVKEDPEWKTSKFRTIHNSIFKKLSMLRARHKRQMTLWNRYVGKDDVLYIHSRCGEGWMKYRDREWFIDACLDAFDPTYCDIYARIEVKEWPEAKGR